MNPKEKAEKSAAAMWESDNSSPWVGIEMVEVDEGRAVMCLTVKHHTSGHGAVIVGSFLRSRTLLPLPAISQSIYSSSTQYHQLYLAGGLG